MPTTISASSRGRYSFDTWLAQQRARGKYLDFDPDKELHERIK